ncbi:MAG: hypothetical protein CMH57_07580 [Myxococcales bacterium]|nr:hypothetical protein [Myxococcales bacterium]
MKALATPFRVGLVILSSIAAVFIMLYYVDNPNEGKDDAIEIHGYMKDATGLAPDGRVQMAGIKVGEIKSIELETRNVRDRNGKMTEIAVAKVTLRVQTSLDLWQGVEKEGEWVNGATMGKATASLVGDFFINLTPGLSGQGKKITGEEGADQIMIVPEPASFDELFAKLDVIAGDISEVTSSLAKTFGGEEGQQKLQAIIDEVKKAVEVLSSLLDGNKEKIDRIVTHTEETTANVSALTRDARSDIRRILNDVQKITGDVRNIVAQSGDDVQDSLGNLKGVLARLQTTLDTLNYSLQNVSEITDKINDGEGTIGVLVNDPKIAEDTQSIINDAQGFVNQIAELRTIVELRSDYLFRQAALKNYVSVRLQPSPDKYYLFELIDDPRGARNLRQTTTFTTDSSQPNVVREEQVITTDDYKFSFQIAKRWNFFTGRFGIIEDSGGLGADLHFLEDQLEIETDVFDFGEDVNPRLRAAFAYNAFQYVYIVAGADDILNDETRDFFTGINIRFDDRDLKALLAIGGTPQF